jgi:hypothetical protein
MPAALPGSTDTQNRANPSAGACVIFDPLSGPKASPFDARTITGYTNSVTGDRGTPTYANDPNNISTGGLCTGIGFGSPPVFNNFTATRNFTDDYIPGADLPDASTQSAYLLYIGGGKSDAAGVPVPYDVADLGLCMAGQGGGRDGGTTPFTGFPVKSVTATGAVANGAAVETGFANRSGVSLVSGQSVFGSSTTPLGDI